LIPVLKLHQVELRTISQIHGGKGGETKKPEPKERQGAMQRIRCFKCNELGHKSSDYPRRKFINITQQELEGDYEEHNTIEEDCNYEVAKEDGEEVVYVVRRLLYTPA
jgi:phage FluMu protein Com